MRDFVVVGGGIAGIAISELLQRSGTDVLLVEKDEKLCSGASAAQQGWFHTGALYAAMPTRRFFRTMVGNLDDLRAYYSEFDRMNLAIDRNISTVNLGGWFTNRTHFYAYTRWRDVGWRKKIQWFVGLRLAKRRMSWLENLSASGILSAQIDSAVRPMGFVVQEASLDADLGETAFTLRSRDRGMNTRQIAADLLNSFLASGGSLKLGREVVDVTDNGVRCLESGGTGSFYEARKVILATGQATGDRVQGVNVLASPLLVVVPPVHQTNVVLMTPHEDETINHVYHQKDGVAYSLIGNAQYHDPEEIGADHRGRIRQRMIRLATKAFGSFETDRSEIYFGHKTERAGRSSRDYLYHIIDADNCVVALPGKYSLCFSLAVNVCRHFGIDPIRMPPEELEDEGEIIRVIDEPKHLKLARVLNANEEADFLVEAGRALETRG